MSTPYGDPWGHWNYATVWGVMSNSDINGSCTGTGTATLTWIPAAGQTLQSDPPSKTVYIEESSSAYEGPGTWSSGEFAPPRGVGSASDGLGDTPVPQGSGYTCSGTHRVKKDGSSGTITLGPFTLTATCPVSTWGLEGDSPEDLHFSWDWFGGNCEVGFSVAVDPPAYPVNFRQDNVSDIGDGVLEFHYTWDSSVSGYDHTDLADWSICEVVEHTANPLGVGFFGYDQDGIWSYVPPDPFDGHHQEPSQLSVPATDGGLEDKQLHFPFSTPYKEASYIGIQKFYALNGTTGEIISLLGPFTITRSVVCTRCTVDGDYYEYIVTENESEASLDLGTGL